MLKKIILSIVLLLTALAIVPLFLPSHVSISRSVNIESSAASVFARLPDLNEYNKWNPFPEGDSTNQTSVSGQGVGSSLTWAGEKTGEGKMTIANIEQNKKIEIKMEFYKPMSGEAKVLWELSEISANTTEMTWTLEQDLPHFNRYFGLIMDSMIGKHFEKGLYTYKQLVEATK